MMINLDELNVDYRNNGSRDEVMDNEQYGVYVQIECFALIRELLNACKELRTEVYELRNEVNALTSFDENIPYPEPARDMPGNSVYISELISSLYEGIFDEDAWCCW
jgi:hypothetical protein